MSDVFLLGAGFSKAISDSMPVMGELSEELLKRIIELPQQVIGLGNNFEHWMTYLSQPQPWLSPAQNLRNKAIFLTLTQEIGALLKERTSQAVANECPDWLKLLVGHWRHYNSDVITLNYDTLIERAVHFGGTGANFLIDVRNIYPVQLPDVTTFGMIGIHDDESFTLFKLHGSVNWYYSGAAEYYGETIYSAPVSPWEGIQDPGEADAVRAASDKVPLIVPPTTEKVTYFQHETIRQVWSRAAQALADASRLYCIGYSLPETDLSVRFFLNNQRRGTLPLTIVNTDLDVTQRYRYLLGDCYSIDDCYVGDEAIQKLVANLQK